uniref:Putative ribonuclease H-like domain-containing protein n=1 Tax=Helianthus annuus TaxID=4232 RepID=A0A251RXP5_HELAN
MPNPAPKSSPHVSSGLHISSSKKKKKQNPNIFSQAADHPTIQFHQSLPSSAGHIPHLPAIHHPSAINREPFIQNAQPQVVMSSHKASNVMENSVELSDGESVELEDEMKDVRDQSSKDVGAKGKRKNASDAKEHFKDIEGIYKGKMVKKKQCIYCKHSYVANSSGTTTSLTRYLKDCTYFQKAQGNSKGFINFGSNRSDKTVFIDEESSGGFNPMKVRELIAKLIIGHELPFSIVDYHWFNQLCKYLNPLFQKVSRSTITRDCIKVVNVERERIKKILKKVDMISLTSDCWTSNQTIGYMCLTAHFVDSDWKLQKLIIGFNELAPPHNGEVISDGILECLIKWVFKIK